MKKAILMRRADANALAARAQARPANPALGRELQALEDHAQDLDSDLAGLDCDLRGLIARAPALVSIKDRVSFLPDIIVAARSNLWYAWQEAFPRAEAAAQKCEESALELKHAVDAASRGR